MSLTKSAHEALRWWQTARDDLSAAKSLLEAGMFSHACFQCQQSGEKAVKALWFFVEADPWGHSIQKPVLEFPNREWFKEIDRWLSNAAFLDKMYIPTRYPNGLPDLTPMESYTKEDAEAALERATFFVEEVYEQLPRK